MKLTGSIDRKMKTNSDSLPMTPDVVLPYCRDLSEWPERWMGVEEALPVGHRLVEYFMPFLLHLAESGLSILGLGPQNEMTLGTMIYWALNYGALLQNLWWWWATPVIILIVLFISLYLVHLGLDEVANPRLRGA